MPRLGIIGGGQLGQMLTLKAVELGLEVAIFERQADSPAARIAAHEIVGRWDDHDAQQRLLAACDVVTLENEFVDSAVLERLRAGGATVLPSPEALRAIQDKFVQKCRLRDNGLPLPRFAAVKAPEDVRRLGHELGWPLLLKARRGAYDGKGNALVRHADEADAVARGLGWPERELYVEEYLLFAQELAVMVVRGRDGETAAYPVVETVQQDHICHEVVAPARIPPALADAAARIARDAVALVGTVGVCGVELFQMPDGRVLVNELAPRPHNSGHYTIEACDTSQFENHIRAVLGWPLGSTALLSPAVMVNLLGSGVATPRGLERALAVPGAHLHLYGKRPSVRGRKMGHVTALAASPEAALERARAAAAAVEV